MNLFDMYLQIVFSRKLFITDVAGVPLSIMDIFLVYTQTLPSNEILLTNIAQIFAAHCDTPRLELRTQ